MACNGGRELTFSKWRVTCAAPLNPTVRRIGRDAHRGGVPKNLARFDSTQLDFTREFLLGQFVVSFPNVVNYRDLYRCH